MNRQIAGGLALIAAALALGLAVATGALTGFDVGGLRALALTAAAPQWLVRTTQIVSGFGTAEPRNLFVIAVCALFVARHCWRSAMAYVLIVVASISGHTWAKVAFGRARPQLTPWYDWPRDLSYPSGHSAGTMIVLLAFALLTRDQWLRWPAIGFALVIGLTRPMLGVHWPTDVIGGWLWGAGFALLGAGLAQRLGLPRPRILNEGVRRG